MNSLSKIRHLLVLSTLAALTSCAPGMMRAPTTLYVSPSEALLLRTEPLDSTVAGELRRGGVDPVAFETEFAKELRYRFFTRKQEEAQDSVSARAILSVSIRHLQPGVANAGTFGMFSVAVTRDGSTVRNDWTARKPSKDNPPAAYALQALVTTAVDEVLKQVPPAKPVPKEPPPPLMLLR